MSGSINKAILIGHLGKDPEVRTLQNGGRVCNLSIATSESWKDKSTGERKERTEWHRVSIFNDNLVTVGEKYLRKGAKVYIEGQIETRKWQDQSGQDRYSTEVVLKQYRGELQMLDGKRDAADQSAQSDNDYSYQTAARTSGASLGPSPAASSSRFDLDDEIPF